MLNLLQITAPNRRFSLLFPKQKFYEHLGIPVGIRQIFFEQIRLIYWKNILSPEAST